jgi:class 3 adenylate cyclase
VLGTGPLNETRKLAAILCSDVVGYSRLVGADEDRILARLRALRSDLIDPKISVRNGRVVKRIGDGILIEFRSVVDAVLCAIEVQNGMLERNAGVPGEPPHRISSRHPPRRRDVAAGWRLARRRGQHRRAIGEHCRAGRDLSFRGY